MHRIPTLAMAMLLLVAACGGTAVEDDGTTTTSSTSTTSTPTSSTTSTSSTSTTSTPTTSTSTSTTSSTTTSTSTSTTSSTTTTSTSTTTTTLAPVLVQGAFSFVSGTSPRVRVLSTVAESLDGPWLPAGPGDPLPVLTGDKYWIRFSISNQDSLGFLESLDLSGAQPDPGPLGPDVCPLTQRLASMVATTCVLGGTDGFDIIAGGAQHFFAVEGQGFRQGDEVEVFFDPPLPESLGYANTPHRFVLVFSNGVRIDGTSFDPEITIALAGVDLSLPLRIDCSDSFGDGLSDTGGSPTGSEPTLIAHVMEMFTEDGSLAESCVTIPRQDLTWILDAAGDFSVAYATN